MVRDAFLLLLYIQVFICYLNIVFIFLDFFRNCFIEIFLDVWLFALFEILNLYYNCIKIIFEVIKNLQMLIYFNIR